MIGETLDNRYNIISLLGTGQYGSTYLAEDIQLRKNARCAIKEFEPRAKDALSLRKAKYLFAREIKILKLLGKSDRIPNLVGHFQQENKFYLVHQFVDGTDLGEEFKARKKLTETEVVKILREILEIVEVAHCENVIHQDIKPSNIIRRKSDGKLMLIDFGSIKKLYNQMANAEGKTELTVPIGTEGYMAPEQKNMKPRLASDVYAVGAIGIAALTGIEPKDIPLDCDTETLQWQNLVEINEELGTALTRMVSPDLNQRYASASEALQTVRNLKLGKKLLDFKTIISMGVLLVGVSGAGYYYWQLETSLSQTPDTAGYYETEKDRFPFLYRNAQYGIEMKYPFNWRLNEPQSDGSNTVAEFFPEQNQSYLIVPKVEIEVEQADKLSLEEYTTNAVYQVTQLPQAKIIDSRPIKFGTGDGHKVIFTVANPNNNIEQKYLQIWTIRGDRTYTITYKAELDRYDEYVEIVEQEMLKSLKIASAG